MASLGPKEVGSDWVLVPEFLVSFTIFALSIDTYLFQESVKCNTYRDKKSIKIGQVLGSIGTKEP